MIYLLHYIKDDVTNNCLAYLVGQPEPVIVIDNGSPEPFKPIHPVAVLTLPRNIPIICAFNEAMQLYLAEKYLCITNDTEPAPGMVARLLEILDDTQVGIVAPGTNDRGAGILFVGDQAREGEPDVETTGVDNTCWAWRQDLIDAIGYPDCEGHTHQMCWASNRDYCYRARQAGYKVVAARSTFIRHAHMGGQDRDAWEAGELWLRQKWGAEARNM